MQWVCQPAPLPAWLTPSTHHYCSWLAPQNLAKEQNKRTETAAARTNEIGLQHREDNAAPGAAAYQVDTADAAHPMQQQQGDTGLTSFGKPVISAAILDSTAQQLLNAAAEDASGTAEAPPAKRARLAFDGTAPAETVSAASWEPVLAQLQAFGETGDISQLDQQQFLQVLSAAALQHTHASMQDVQHLQQLQQQLADLSADACLVLLQELLAAFSNSSSSSGMNGGSATQLQPTAKQLSEPDLTFLLTHALLPKLRSLSAAAPKSLLGCLTALGHSNAHDVLVDSVLAPLVVSDGLLPVQVQLLVKLAKEADGLQPRLLDLLLLAALGHSPASNPAPCTHAAPTALGGGSSFWREPHASLFKSLLDLAPQHVSQQLPSVVSALQAAVQHLAKSTVFGQLLMGLLKSFAASFSKQQVGQLQQVVGCTATFLSKSLSSKLQQLQEQHAQLQS